ncbi:hypothetical protein C1646_774332 [Rhizophagus diaphanus]|nr:hypothetical protein C1646_774332 [Rhizophagus diaphanus] [Rhizophagus sp. MUCL 43196]
MTIHQKFEDEEETFSWLDTEEWRKVIVQSEAKDYILIDRENEGIDFLDHFSLESVIERLKTYNVSNIPDIQALADVMIMLCIRPAEIKTLCISNGSVTGYAKNWGQQDNPQVFISMEKNEERARQLLTWIQDAITLGQIHDPGKPGSVFLSTFLKKDEFLPESGKPLLPSSLRKLGSVFASVVHGPKNPSKANTYGSEACFPI